MGNLGVLEGDSSRLATRAVAEILGPLGLSLSPSSAGLVAGARANCPSASSDQWAATTNGRNTKYTVDLNTAENSDVPSSASIAVAVR